MILTNCAACAAPLAHNAPRCVRCKLRYCNATCQAVTTLEEIGPTSRRVLGGTHPLTEAIEGQLRNTRDVGAALRDLDEAQVASEEVSG